MSSCGWYGEWFDDWYLKIYSHRDRVEAEGLVNLTLKLLDLPPGSRILDLCCGTGRHAEHFRRQGFVAVGMDLSMTLLQHSRTENSSLGLVRGNMGALPFKPIFDAVVNFFTSFGYFEKDEENRAVLAQIKAVLKPGGKFMIDLPNSVHTLAHLVSSDKKSHDGCEVVQKRRYNKKTRRIEKDISISAGKETRRYRESVRLYSAEEMLSMAKTVGLVRAVAVDGHGKTFSAASERMVIHGEAP